VSTSSACTVTPPQHRPYGAEQLDRGGEAIEERCGDGLTTLIACCIPVVAPQPGQESLRSTDASFIAI
jgi:hypothetical protein